MRKQIAIFLLLVAISSRPASADEYASAHRLKTAGIVLTSIGAALSLTATVLLISGVCIDNCSSGAGTRAALGLVAAPLGGGSLILGIPLLVVGAEREQRANKLRVFLVPNGIGGTF